jgi:hypothetical protein
MVDLGVRGSVATDVQCWSDGRFRCKGFCSLYSAGLMVDLGVRGSVATDIQC